MNWKMVFVIYAQGREEKIVLTRYRLSNKDDVKFFLTNFFEEQKGLLIEEEREGRGWGIEMVLVDEWGREIPIKNLYEIIYEGEEVLRFFSMTSRAIEQMIAGGIS